LFGHDLCVTLLPLCVIKMRVRRYVV
jgi:hypothetical protein